MVFGSMIRICPQKHTKWIHSVLIDFYLTTHSKAVDIFKGNLRVSHKYLTSSKLRCISLHGKQNCACQEIILFKCGFFDGICRRLVVNVSLYTHFSAEFCCPKHI